MGIFGKLLGKDQDKNAINSPANNDAKPIANATIANAPSHATEQDLLEYYVGICFDKQADLYEAIGDNAWNADLKACEISFGEGKTYAVQTLGTYSHQSNSWLWAWANKQADWPDSVQTKANQLKAYGDANHIDIFSNGSFGAPISDVHLIGLIASGLFASSAYYIADYGQGAMLYLIEGDKLAAAKNQHARVITVIPQMISAYEMNHKMAITHYLNAKNYTISSDAGKLSAEKNGNSLIAQFDELNRLTNLDGQLNP